MSEPVTHAEIEDVLSSIRRLVRETGRTEDVATPPSKPATRLVLTPALRVPETEHPGTDSAQGRAAHLVSASEADSLTDRDPETAESDDETPTSDRAGDDAQRNGAATMSEVDAIALLRQKASANEPSPDPSAQEPSRVLFRASAPAEDLPRTEAQSAEPCEKIAEAPFVNVDDAKLSTAQEETQSAPILLKSVQQSQTDAQPFEAEVGEEQAELSAISSQEPTSEPLTEPQAEIQTEERAETQLETLGDTSLEVASGADVKDPSFDASLDAPWRDPDARLFDSLETATATSSPQPATDETPSSPREQSSRVAAVVRRIAELETAERNEAEAIGERASRAPEINEDEIEAVPHSGPTVETIQWEEHQDAPSSPEPSVAEPEAVAETAQDMAHDVLTDAAMNRLAANEDFLDEEGLRELVSTIVREELQGALGERITRNVRKLVRREIQRALTTQELL